MASKTAASEVTRGSWFFRRKFPIERGDKPLNSASERSVWPLEVIHSRARARASRMGLFMAVDYAQSRALRNGKKRRTSDVTATGRSAELRSMPRMSRGAKAAYDSGRVREAMERFRQARGLTIRPWAEKAGVAPGAVYNFLKIADPDAKPGTKPPKKPTEAPLISMFARLAWAAGATVSELIGESGAAAPAEPEPKGTPSPPSESDVLIFARLLTKTQEDLLAAKRQVFALRQEIEELKKAPRRNPGDT